MSCFEARPAAAKVEIPDSDRATGVAGVLTTSGTRSSFPTLVAAQTRRGAPLGPLGDERPTPHRSVRICGTGELADLITRLLRDDLLEPDVSIEARPTPDAGDTLSIVVVDSATAGDPTAGELAEVNRQSVRDGGAWLLWMGGRRHRSCSVRCSGRASRAAWSAGGCERQPHQQPGGVPGAAG